MSNILPQSYKKKLLKDYRLRFLNVALWMCTCLIVSGCLLLIPSYVMSGSVEHSLRSRIESLNASGKANLTKEVVDEIKVTTQQINYLDTYLGAITTPSKVYVLLHDLQQDGVTVEGISIQTTTGMVEINGNALTRNDLRLFVDQLKKVQGFTNVVLPLANLANERNVDFSVTLEVPDLVIVKPTEKPQSPQENSSSDV